MRAMIASALVCFASSFVKNSYALAAAIRVSLSMIPRSTAVDR